MARKPKVTDNTLVSNWMLEYKWLKPISDSTLHRIPSFVEDAVYSALYTVAGSSDGRLNISPKLIKKALMLKQISVDTVRFLEVGYVMSDRQAQRLAQTVRFAITRIEDRIDEYENQVSERKRQELAMEREFVRSYYNKTKSPLHSHTAQTVHPAQPLPQNILDLYTQKRYVDFAKALLEHRGITVGE